MAVIGKEYILADAYFGVKHTDDDGNEFSDGAWTAIIDAAQDLVARQFGMLLGGDNYVTRTDIQPWPTGKDLHFNLDHVPIREIASVHMQAGTYELVTVPAEWINILEADAGYLEIVPFTGSVQISSLGSIWLLSHRGSGVPIRWKFAYTAGYKTSDAPASLKRLIALTVAMSLLPVSGDLILGAGVASSSIGIDGLSQSVSTTASAMYGGYSSRLEAFKKEVDILAAALRHTHNGYSVA